MRAGRFSLSERGLWVPCGGGGPFVLPFSTGLVFLYEFRRNLVTLNGSGLLIGVKDSSGNGQNATDQGDASRRLLWEPASFNGRSAVAKGGAASPFIKSATGLNLSYPLVVYLGVEATADPVGTIAFDGSALTARAGLWSPVSGTMQMFGGAGTLSAAYVLTGAKTLFTCIYDGASSELRANGVSLGTGNLTTAAAIDSFVDCRFSLANVGPYRKAIWGVQTGHPSGANIALNEAAMMARLGM